MGSRLTWAQDSRVQYSAFLPTDAEGCAFYFIFIFLFLSQFHFIFIFNFIFIFLVSFALTWGRSYAGRGQ